MAFLLACLLTQSYGIYLLQNKKSQNERRNFFMVRKNSRISYSIECHLQVWSFGFLNHRILLLPMSWNIFPNTALIDFGVELCTALWLGSTIKACLLRHNTESLEGFGPANLQIPAQAFDHWVTQPLDHPDVMMCEEEYCLKMSNNW